MSSNISTEGINFLFNKTKLKKVKSEIAFILSFYIFIQLFSYNFRVDKNKISALVALSKLDEELDKMAGITPSIPTQMLSSSQDQGKGKKWLIF